MEVFRTESDLTTRIISSLLLCERYEETDRLLRGENMILISFRARLK